MQYTQRNIVQFYISHDETWMMNENMLESNQ